jgi:hypothetical protein
VTDNILIADIIEKIIIIKTILPSSKAAMLIYLEIEHACIVRLPKNLPAACLLFFEFVYSLFFIIYIR